jgi:hypothetical protein
MTLVCVRLSGRVFAAIRDSSILSRSNDPVPVETRLQLVLAVLAHEMTVQVRIWQKGSEYVDLVPSPTSRP